MTQAFDVTDPLGADMMWGDDLDEGARMVSGVALLAQEIFARWTTPRGRLIDDPDYGEDVRALLHRGMTPAQLAQVPARLETEALKDERVEAITVRISEDSPGVWRVTAFGEAAEGPFELVVGVSDASVILLEGSAV